MATLTENQGTIDLLRADLTAACVDRDRALKRWRDVCDAWEAMRAEIEELKGETATARAKIGREWLRVFDALIEDAKVQYATAQDMDRRDLCFFWAGKQSGLRYLRTLAEEDIATPAQAAPPACPRCGTPLDNVAPGVSVVAGGISVCTPCLRPGETEIARARGLT